MSRISIDAMGKLNVCRFCSGYERHTCTSFTCPGAVRKAEQQYRKEREKYMEEPFYAPVDKGHYGKTVMEALHEVLQVGMGEDIDSIRKKYSLDEILDAVLLYEGIIGYSGKLIGIIEDIFRVNLLELDV